MSKIKVWDQKIEINIKFPDVIYNKYLKKINRLGNYRLELNDIEVIFDLVYKDFKSGKISLDIFAEISNHLWYEIIHLKKDKNKLFDVLHEASELNFCIRVVTKQNSGNLIQFLADIDEYFKNH